MDDLMTAGRVVRYFRKHGQLNRGEISVKGNAVVKIAKDCDMSEGKIKQILHDMRKDGLIQFCDGRPEESVFLFEEWKRRQEPVPPSILEPKLSAPIAGEEKSVTASEPPVESAPAPPPAPPEIFTVQTPIKKRDPMLDRAETIVDVFLAFGKRLKYSNDDIVYDFKHLIQTVRSNFKMQAAEVAHVLEYMHQNGWIDFKNGKRSRPRLEYTAWLEQFTIIELDKPPVEFDQNMLAVAGGVAYAIASQFAAEETKKPQLQEKKQGSLQRTAFSTCRVTSYKRLRLPASCTGTSDASGGTCPVNFDTKLPAVAALPEKPRETPPPEKPKPVSAPPAPLTEKETVEKLEVMEDLDPQEEMPTEPLPVTPTRDFEVVPAFPANASNPIEKALDEVIGYFEKEDTKDLGQGFSSVVIRRLAGRLRAGLFYRPLAEGDSVAAVCAFEDMRNAILRELHDLDEQISGLINRNVELPSTDLRRAIDKVLDTDVPRAVELQRPFLVKFRGARRQLFEAARIVQTAIAGMDLDTQLVELDILESDFAAGRAKSDQRKVDSYAKIVNRLQQGYDEYRAAHVNYVRQREEITKLQASYPEVRTCLNSVTSELDTLTKMVQMLSADVAATHLPSIQEAERQLGSQNTEQEVYGELPSFAIPRSLEKLEKRLQRCAAEIDTQRTKANSIFLVRLTRKEELRRLMIIAAAHLFPRSSGRRGMNLSYFSKSILFPSGLITADEVEVALDAISADCDDLFESVRDGRMLRYTPNDDCRKRATEYRKDCTDPSELHRRFDQASAEYLQKWLAKK